MFLSRGASIDERVDREQTNPKGSQLLYARIVSSQRPAINATELLSAFFLPPPDC